MWMADIHDDVIAFSSDLRILFSHGHTPVTDACCAWGAMAGLCSRCRRRPKRREWKFKSNYFCQGIPVHHSSGDDRIVVGVNTRGRRDKGVETLFTWIDELTFPFYSNFTIRISRRGTTVKFFQVSIIGLRHVIKSTTCTCRRLVWVVLLLAGTAFTIFQIQDRVVCYMSRKTDVGVRVEYVDSMRFPSMTICNENRIQRTNAMKHGESRNRVNTLWLCKHAAL